jgi:hypothetical protein
MSTDLTTSLRALGGACAEYANYRPIAGMYPLYSVPRADACIADLLERLEKAEAENGRWSEKYAALHAAFAQQQTKLDEIAKCTVLCMSCHRKVHLALCSNFQRRQP